MSSFTEFTAAEAREHIAVPRPDDDKYSRGVLGIITGSPEYPGAAVLGVEAALRTGVGMVRFVGAKNVATLVLQRRPEAVTTDGRVQAWLLGSGMDVDARDDETTERLSRALGQGVPAVIDAGALDLLSVASRTAGVVITPHFGELARVLAIDRETIRDNPADAALRASDQLGVTVLLKGHRSYIAAADGSRFMCTGAPAWLATAGAGDALGGILGALVASHAKHSVADVGMLARLAATACVVHSLAAHRASAGGPFTILDLAEQLSPTIARLIA